MTPFRYSFETDQQYQARTGATLQTNTNMPLAQASIQHSTTHLAMPWWVITGLVFIVLPYAFIVHRRNMIERRLQKNAKFGVPRFILKKVRHHVTHRSRLSHSV